MALVNSRLGGRTLRSYLLKEWVIEGSIFPLQFMDLFVEFRLDVGTLHLQPFQGVDSPLHYFGYHALRGKTELGLNAVDGGQTTNNTDAISQEVELTFPKCDI